MKELYFEESAKDGDVRISMEMNDLIHEEEERMKKLFIEFADKVKKSWESRTPNSVQLLFIVVLDDFPYESSKISIGQNFRERFC